MSSSSTLLCMFLLLGCIGIATDAATEPKTENNFATSSIRLWPRWWWLTHPKIPSPPTPSPSPSTINNAASPHTALSWAPVPTPTTYCIKVDNCALDLVTSVFKRRISLSTQCCQVVSTISDDCFYREYTHSKRVPFFLGKVRNYCSHAVDNAIPSPSPVDNAASPPHASPSPSPVVNVASPTHTSPSPSSVDNVASPTHVAPSLVDNVASPTHVAPTPSLVDNAAPPTHAVPSPSPVDDVILHQHMDPSWGPTTSLLFSSVEFHYPHNAASTFYDFR
ncbi:extensin-like [Solanum pennellii]|uniref:Extensin-like n=1 Tax=Solanum pennellii TaxID=28526 RepID=A0ABM1VI77_SOLPN|nr:extensin-like [Solanum pennellii]